MSDLTEALVDYRKKMIQDFIERLNSPDSIVKFNDYHVGNFSYEYVKRPVEHQVTLQYNALSVPYKIPVDSAIPHQTLTELSRLFEEDIFHFLLETKKYKTLLSHIAVPFTSKENGNESIGKWEHKVVLKK